jgi:thiol-disulfide isomerase/thioredoxin
MRTFLIFVLSIFLNFNLVSGQSEQEKSSKTVLNQDVPTFKFKPVSQQKHIDITELKGKTVLVNFFATWCGPCLKEIPFLKSEIYEPFKDEEFVILMIGREHSDEIVAAFKAEKDIPFYVVGDEDRSIYDLFAEKYIPRNYIINPDGKIVYQHVGFNDKEFEDMVAILKETLQKYKQN